MFPGIFNVTVLPAALSTHVSVEVVFIPVDAVVTEATTAAGTAFRPPTV
jgi:hypothetical protein